MSGRDVKVADVLDRAAEALDKEFTGSAATKGALSHALGSTYKELGLYREAVKRFEQARAAREAALGLSHPDTIDCRQELVETYSRQGRLADAVTYGEETLTLSTDKLGLDHVMTLRSQGSLAGAYQAVGRRADAVARIRVDSQAA